METLILSRDYPVELELSLPCKGKVLVRAGQRVKAGDLIAEASFPAHYQFFDLIQEFGIRPEDLEKALQRKEGDPLSAGDLIAWKKGFLGHYLRASEDGALILARDGRLTLAYGEKKLRLKAPYEGLITTILTGKGAVLANQSMAVQAELMLGKRCSGPFVYLTTEELVKQPRRLDKDLKNTVLWLDGLLTQRLWERVKGLELSALVLASAAYDSGVFKESLPFSVLLLMGMGEISLDEISRTLLTDMLGMIVILEPKGRSGGAERPILFRVWDSESHPLVQKPLEQAKPGSPVRLLGKPYHGLLARIEEISKNPESFASGAFARAALLRIGDDTLVRLPLNNIELILS
ncbi:MAG: hypothetical protein VB108_07785 [Anaerolineaceae bacterium]|nr:hypothetical protein [Anaerolineaceae bacterium]